MLTTDDVGSRVVDYMTTRTNSRIDQLDERVARLETYLEEKADSSSSASALLEHSSRSFDAVLGAYRSHEENAGRILAALAFLTAASVGLLAQASRQPDRLEDLRDDVIAALSGTSNPSQLANINRAFDVRVANYASIEVPYLGYIDVPTVAFATFLLFALIAAASYLAVLWPSIEFDRDVSDYRRSTFNVESRLFYRTIAPLSYPIWKSHWAKVATEHSQAIHEDLVAESLLLARRALKKEKLSQLGSWMFRIALYPLTLLAFSLLLPNTSAFVVAAAIGITALCMAFWLEATFHSDAGEHWKEKVLVALILVATWIPALRYLGL